MTTATSLPGRVLQQRESLRRRPDCRFVAPEEFFRLVVSREHLERADDPMSGTLGLHNPTTGTTYVVEAEKVYAASHAIASA